jgi:hypothetical protein
LIDSATSVPFLKGSKKKNEHPQFVKMIFVTFMRKKSGKPDALDAHCGRSFSTRVRLPPKTFENPSLIV